MAVEPNGGRWRFPCIGEKPSAYKVGYQDGYQSGLSSGYSTGFSEGRQQGDLEGYNRGFTEGELSGDAAGYARGFAAGELAGYDNGYQAGLGAGGFQEGFLAGKQEGYDEGYQDGYAQGVQDSEPVPDADEFIITLGAYSISIYNYYGYLKPNTGGIVPDATEAGWLFREVGWERNYYSLENGRFRLAMDWAWAPAKYAIVEFVDIGVVLHSVVADSRVWTAFTLVAGDASDVTYIAGDSVKLKITFVEELP